MKHSPRASFLLTITLLLGMPIAWLYAQEQSPAPAPGASQDTMPADTPAAGNDTRKLIDMPPYARDLMRQDMLTHMTALSQIFAVALYRFATGRGATGAFTEAELSNSIVPRKVRPGRI